MTERTLGCPGCNRLEAEVKRLTKERDEATRLRNKAASIAYTGEAQNQRLEAALTAARAEGERYREVLNEIADRTSVTWVVRDIAVTALATGDTKEQP